MSDLMLHGVLNMPTPDDPKDLGQIEWMQFRDRARQASKHISDLEAQLADRTAERNKLAADLSSLRAAIEEKGGTESYPTEYAYLAVCDAMRNAKAENAALRAQINRARDDALEEAAHWHDERAADEMAISSKYRSGSNPWFAHIQKAKAHAENAAAIRALRTGDA